jgi:predicted phosphodiesterase
MLFVQNTEHVQVIWEMNCGMKNKEMALTYWNDKDHKYTVPVEPTILDESHTVYKATIGPLDQLGKQITYSIDLIKNEKKKQIAKHSFDWFAEVKDQPIRIAAMADNQFGMLTYSSLLRQIKKFPKRNQPHFLLHAGDAVQNYPSLRQWQTDFAAPLSIHSLSQTHPLIYAHGNHDYDSLGEYIYTRTSDDPWFAFSMAKRAVRFIVLDSNVDWEMQDRWLQDEIKSPSFQEAQFRIVVVHVPPFLEYWDPEAWFQLKESEWGAFIKDRYVPLFEQGGVDLVISGHQHNYERGERNGIHYAIIGGAGGDIDFEQVKDWGMYEAKLLDFHFVMMEIRPPEEKEEKDDAWTLQWDTFDIKGKKVDSVLITSHAKKLREINEEEN